MSPKSSAHGGVHTQVTMQDESIEEKEPSVASPVRDRLYEKQLEVEARVRLIQRNAALNIAFSNSRPTLMGLAAKVNT
jgi:hypothetical protein